MYQNWSISYDKGTTLREGVNNMGTLGVKYMGILRIIVSTFL